jgi:hypothetical protein
MTTYIIMRGTMTPRNHGEVTDMTTIVLITEKKVIRKALSDLGIASSMVYTSFEKRLSIRPRGVVSKKAMGERSMLESMLLWSLFDPRRAL